MGLSCDVISCLSNKLGNCSEEPKVEAVNKPKERAVQIENEQIENEQIKNVPMENYLNPLKKK